MAKFSNASKEKLETCHDDLVTLFNEVIKHFDCKVIYGHRSPEEQRELFKIGRARNHDGTWTIVDKKKVVTYIDGETRMSKHNYIPSRAIDVAPYPINFNDTRRIMMFIGMVLGVAKMLKQDGRITHEIVSGADWDSDTDLSDQSFNDLLHFELK